MGCRVLGLLLLLSLVLAKATAAHAVLDWLRSEGGYVHPMLELRHTPESGWGLWATGDVPGLVPIVAVPQHLILHPKSIMDRFYPEWNFLALPPEAAVGLFLAVERWHGTRYRSKWRTLWDWYWNRTLSWGPYLQSLPARSPLNLAHWRHRDYLSARDVFGTEPDLPNAASLYQRHLVDSMYTRNVIPVTRSKFAWGYSLAMSRSFEGAFLVPVVDFCNHATEAHHARLDLIPDAFAKTLAKAVDRGPLQFQLDRNITAGQQVFFDYGPHSSLQWLLAFGWEPPGRPFQGEVLVHNSSGHEVLLDWNTVEVLAHQGCQPKGLPRSDQVRWRNLLPNLRQLLMRCRNVTFGKN